MSLRIILRRHPEADDVRAIFLDVGFGGLRLFVTALALFAFGDLFAIGIDHETVSQHGLDKAARRCRPATAAARIGTSRDAGRCLPDTCRPAIGQARFGVIACSSGRRIDDSA